MLKGVLSLLLLHLVTEREDYGYSIVVRLQHQGFEDLTEGSVYPALSRLEANGLLGSRLVRSASGPARKYYAPTAAGDAELRRCRAAWEALVGAVRQVLPAATITTTTTTTATDRGAS
jgi:PadR family transcriptional regulator PadR